MLVSGLREAAKSRVWKRLIRLGMRERVDGVWGCFERDMKECSTVLILSQYLLLNGIHSNEDGARWVGIGEVKEADGDADGSLSQDAGISRTWGAACCAPTQAG